MSVWEKAQVILVSKNVSTIQEDTTALALMVSNLYIIPNVKVGPTFLADRPDYRFVFL